MRLPGIAPGTYRVTLITGDRVTLRAAGQGRFAVQVDTAPRSDGSQPIVNVTSTKSPSGDDPALYAVPDDAAPLIADGRLDRELFNIGYLVASGYHDGARDDLPVIVEHGDDVANLRTASSTALPGVTVNADLESIDASAAAIDTDRAADLWASLGPARTARAPQAPSRTSLGRSVDRIWLDRVVTVSLDESVPQIGAPDAWAAGFDGTDVDVAVLDTGLDLGHADVASKVTTTRSFVDGQEVTDGHGHGTHVASIIAGAGAASDGEFTGVAPGASLIIGKVLGDDGVGSESDVIEGMEWAAQEEDADIVNLSLGSIPTDGTDPASQAVDQLTASTGALFVIAAGNDGPRTFSVTSPGTADAALTIGAVDGGDALASFSSRGPRVGDYAIKPELTAPGVSITAARAAGTRMPGSVPVDDNYTTASGTSMATPHVAGAAAILTQQRPDWSPAQLKAALVATAEDGGYSVHQQGSGRVDVARAFTQAIQIAPATADFALIPTPGDEAPRTRDLTYTNPSPEPVTLELAATLHTGNGEPAPAGTLAVGPSTVVVPAEGSATTTVTLDPSGLDSDVYSGAIVASAGDTRLRTPVGVVVGEQQHSLRITVQPREGVDGFEFSGLGMYGVEGGWAGESITCGSTDCPQPLEFLLADGIYSVRVLVSWNDASGERQLGVLIDPEVVVSDDTELVLDANEAEQITVATEQPSEPLRISPFSIFRSSSDGAFRLINAIIATPTQKWWVTPTQAVTRGEMAVASHWLVGPPTPADQSPSYLYSLKLTEEGRVPDSLHYQFRDRDLVRVDNRYHADQPGEPLRQVWFTWAPWEFAVGGFNHPLVGQTRVPEYVFPARSDFIHERGLRPSAGGFTPIDEVIDVYRQGDDNVVVDWNERPNAPGAVVLPKEIGKHGLTAPLWWWVCAACRQGDNFYPFMHQTAPGERNTLGQFGRPFGFGEMHLFRDGVEVPESEPLIGAFTTYTLAPEPASYRVTLDHEGTSTAWQFASSRPTSDATPPGQSCLETVFTAGSAAPCAPQPLLFLRYDANVGIDNRVAAASAHTLFVTAYQQDGRPPRVKDLRLWVSTDDGAGWQEVAVKRQGKNRYRATVRYPPIEDTTGQVSLRAQAVNVDGNSIEQTIIGAFGLRALDVVP